MNESQLQIIELDIIVIRMLVSIVWGASDRFHRNSYRNTILVSIKLR